MHAQEPQQSPLEPVADFTEAGAAATTAANRIVQAAFTTFFNIYDIVCVARKAYDRLGGFKTVAALGTVGATCLKPIACGATAKVALPAALCVCASVAKTAAFDRSAISPGLIPSGFSRR